MKKIVYLFCVLILGSCDTENANNCFQKAGAIVQIEVEVPVFSRVVVHERIELIIQQGDEQKVIVESGENLLSDVTVEVIDNELILKDYNTCNFFREYNLTKVYITTPNLTRIRNASEYNVSSNGTLTFKSLELISIGDEDVYLPIGDFHLTLYNEKLKISSNGIANFYLEGATDDLDINFFDLCDSRFEGENFIAQKVKVTHISSNDILVYPVESIEGSIRSTGDLICYNTPPIVAVDVMNDYGTLIFK